MILIYLHRLHITTSSFSKIILMFSFRLSAFCMYYLSYPIYMFYPSFISYS